jgi:DNA modification methylase
VTIHYSDDAVTLHAGDCLDVLRELPADSVDAVVTDPPYDLTAGKRGGSGAASVNLDSPYGRSRIGTGNGAGGFMGKAWDGTGIAFRPEVWIECLRVLKPGGHLLAFGGSRTWHRLTSAVEDAGFEIRDSIAWLYGSGFPKSLDVSKAIDKAAGAERPTTLARIVAADRWTAEGRAALDRGESSYEVRVTAPATPDAERWQGWGTALKPAFEPIVVARKPLAGTVAANVLAHGVGALNVDGCRIGSGGGTKGAGVGPQGDVYGDGLNGAFGQPVDGLGRWPANVLLDASQADALDAMSGVTTSTGGKHSGRSGTRDEVGGFGYDRTEISRPTDSGGASRFFYTAKADQHERPKVNGVAHPTVKPLDLMRWLVRLVTPPGGTVLEPFAGSGTTAEACVIEGFKCIAIEREPDYLPLIVARLTKPIQVGLDFDVDGLELSDPIDEATA